MVCLEMKENWDEIHREEARDCSVCVHKIRGFDEWHIAESNAEESKN